MAEQQYEWWVVVDETGLPAFITIDRQMAQDHINDALQEHGIKEAAKWVVRRAYAAPQQREPLTEWQPIETAPKDFVSDIDVWAKNERVADVSWAHPEYSPKGYYAWCKSVYINSFGYENEEVKGVTHWMPIPNGPKAARGIEAAEGVKHG